MLLLRGLLRVDPLRLRFRAHGGDRQPLQLVLWPPSTRCFCCSSMIYQVPQLRHTAIRSAVTGVNASCPDTNVIVHSLLAMRNCALQTCRTMLLVKLPSAARKRR